MPEIALSAYEGPATVAGLALPLVDIREHAEIGEGSGTVLKYWDGTATFTKDAVPDFDPHSQEVLGLFDVTLPNVGSGTAYLMDIQLANGRRWTLEFTGKGPSPLV